MKLTLTIDSDQIHDDLRSALASITTNALICQLNPEMLDAVGPITVPLRRSYSWDEVFDKPAPFGELVITKG